MKISSSTLRFSPLYAKLTVLLLAIEICIALFIHDRFIRPYIGDFLVVILIYCFVKSFLNTPVVPSALGVLGFAYTVEVLQYFNLVERLGLQHSRPARIIIGSSFEWADLLAYTAGVGLIILVERLRKRK